MNLATFGLALAFLTFCNGYKEHYENVTSEVSTEDLSSPVLSRRKRFLIFPDGSSFQLVFCTQNHGYLQIGDIVWFGSTAALAWELPSDPSLFNMFKGKLKDDIINRRVDKNIYYLDEDGKVLGKVPYKRRPIVNPAFAKRSIDSRISKKQLHVKEEKNNYFNDLNENSIEFHRTGRISLYEKVEKILLSLGWKGEECVQRLLCEYGKKRKNQGTFLGEIIRATFSLPKGRDSTRHKRYDVAQGRHDCSVYPSCQDFHGLNLYEHIDT